MSENSISAGPTRWPDWVFAAGLMIASVAAGYVINALRPQPLPLQYMTKADRMDMAVREMTPAASGPSAKAPESPAVAASEAVPAAHPDLSLEEFIAYAKARRGLVVDARPEVFYRLGHVPYAISLPRENFAAAYALVRSRWETDRAVPLVIYCSSPTCEDAGLVQTSLRKLGFTHVAVFRGGWSEWTAAHQEEERLP